MTKWEKRADYDKTLIDANSFIKEVVDNMETYTGNLGNATAHLGLSSANSVVEITKGVRVLVQEVMDKIRQTTEATKD